MGLTALAAGRGGDGFAPQPTRSPARRIEPAIVKNLERGNMAIQRVGQGSESLSFLNSKFIGYCRRICGQGCGKNSENGEVQEGAPPLLLLELFCIAPPVKATLRL